MLKHFGAVWLFLGGEVGACFSRSAQRKILVSSLLPLLGNRDLCCLYPWSFVATAKEHLPEGTVCLSSSGCCPPGPFPAGGPPPQSAGAPRPRGGQGLGAGVAGAGEGFLWGLKGHGAGEGGWESSGEGGAAGAAPAPPGAPGAGAAASAPGGEAAPGRPRPLRRALGRGLPGLGRPSGDRGSPSAAGSAAHPRLRAEPHRSCA